MSKKKQISANGFDIEMSKNVSEYNRVVESANLSSVNVVKIDFEVKPFYFNNEKRKLTYDAVLENLDFDRDAGIGTALIEFSVTSRSGKLKTLICKAQYIVSYKDMKGYDEEAVGRFLRKVSVFTAYPYFRSLLATIDWSASTSMPALPILKGQAVS